MSTTEPYGEGPKTYPGMNYFLEWCRLLVFSSYVQVEWAAREAKRGTDEPAPEESKDKDPEDPKPDQVWETTSVMAEMIVCRVVDSFLVYLAEMLALIYITCPDSMKSGEVVRLDEVLSYSSKDELVRGIARRRVDSLAFQGMRKVSEAFQHLGVRIFMTPEDEALGAKIIEIRNIVVHNRGIVNETFTRRVPDFPAEVGDRVVLTVETMYKYCDFIHATAFGLDKRCLEQFVLPEARGPFESPKEIVL